MTFCFTRYGDLYYIELYRIGGDFYTGFRIGIQPWKIWLNISLLGVHFCFNFGKEYGE